MITFFDAKTVGIIVALTMSQSLYFITFSLVTSKSYFTTPAAADTDIKVTCGVLGSDDHWAASSLYFLK